MDIAQWVQDYGEWFYAITFVWTFLEGETFVLFAGLGARQGILRLDLLIVFAWLGSFAGDQLYFWIGRRWGNHLLRRFPRWSPGVHAALDMLRKYDTGFVLSFRFIYGVRNFSSFAMGTSGLSWVRFLVLNFLAAGVWAVAFAGIGYIVGATFEHLLGDLAIVFGLVMLGIFCGVILMITRAQKRRLAPTLPISPMGSVNAVPVAVETDPRS
jgi:membrane protein DedA with SNARE-associated domain